MGNTKAIGTAYSDQDLNGSKLTNCTLNGGSLMGNPSGGKIVFADSAKSGGDGSSWDSAYNTITAAYNACVAGDMIICRGSFNETLTVAKAGMSIVGAGTSTKQAQWTSATDTATVTIAANNVYIGNIYFKPPAYTASTTYGPSAILLSGANYAMIQGCRFQGQTASYNAIYSPVCNSDNVTIDSNQFQYMNTATSGCAILGVEAGGLSYSAWQITNNVFASCVTAINVNCRVGVITGNTVAEYGIVAAGTVGAVLALGIDLSGTSSGANMVWNNQLGGTYSSTLYKVGASGDQWAGNLNVLTGGVTAANPA